ncbi:CheA signal transduction histidine kinase [Acidimicrobium ferrooxidans DSM 10331]|uniref:histidine kinase n=1 Tax=Acidimicrobium ferrooxidans (strain DSM 10331 / JCM 15462 / NBRC 103882 / ICP) TaxID=525909 RepID=C7M283_ACIFD|nr:chemotaxis protein CheA [Acidimicrobium ferrooxidans]ACU53181.1 CheA signal transduction histidine kinase [Acidimicrobium ferrooxidans DSM 10331]
MTGASPEELAEFLAESQENLDRFDRDVLALESDPSNRDAVASAFRAIHTLKGTCGFLGFGRLEGLAHDGESLLARVRDGAVRVDAAVADALLALEDAVRRSLDAIAATGDEDDEHWEELRARLVALAEQAHEAPRSVAGANAVVFAPAPSSGAPAELSSGPESQASVEGDVARGAEPDGKSGARPTLGETAVRVDVGLLDRLMNLVGELVLARNRVMQLAQSEGSAALAASTQQLSIIASELQEQVMKTRMQPIDTLFAKLPRVVRDLARELGREVELVLEGRDTELDRTIIEAIRDPMTHLIRNAIDHGIEPPDERRSQGKAAHGVLRIDAYHEGGSVIIDVSDDGRGIDLEAVRARALARGLVHADELARLGPREVAELIFVPGFSTATTVSAVSGRGVGMDVVKTNVESVGGSIDIDSDPGRGTRMRLRIPLTLAIIPALMVETHGQRFAIPQAALAELVRLELDGRHSLVEIVDHTPVLRRRDRLVPLLDLGAILGLAPPFPERGLDAVSVVILSAGATSFGIVVDRIVDTQEIVVKPLGQFVSQLQCYSGATILGDGRVALIVDVGGIAQLGGLAVERAHETTSESVGEAESEAEPVIVLAAGGTERLGVRLREIERLEEFALGAVEYVEGHEVVQYRGGVMRLVRLAHLVGLASQPARPDPINVIVAVDPAGQLVGLVVDEVLDMALAPVSRTHGAIVLDGKLVRVLELDALLERAGEVSHV